MKTALHRPFIPSSGLTLLELLVVLSILAVLSTVALTSSSGLADQARYEATQRTLENIREAVLGPANLRDTDGTLLYTGFVADTGRLPRAVAIGPVLTLAELVEQPAGMDAYDVLQATSANIVVEPPLVAADEQDSEVVLGVGWRGSYLRLTPGNILPRDGWGAQLVTQVVADPLIPDSLLDTANGVVAAGDPIEQIVSYGRDGAVGGAEAYDDDLNVAFAPSSHEAELTVQVEFRNAAGVISAPPPARDVFVRLFGPDPTIGRIRVRKLPEQTTPDPAAITTMSFSFSDIAPGIPLTIGPRAVRAYFDHDGDPMTDYIKSPPAYLMLRPGQNTRTLVVTVP